MFEFLKTSNLKIDTFYDIDEINYNEFILKIYDNNLELFFVKKDPKNVIIFGEIELLDELVRVVIESNIYFKKLSLSNISKEFLDRYIKIMGGRYYPDNDSYYYIEGKIKRLLLAGGCFWCASKPYYDIDGVIKIISGYAGGIELMPKYENVKAQKTSHRETILVIYDSLKTDYKELIDVFLSSIDPFDGDGQFIDRGNSYTTAIYSNDMEVCYYSKNRFKELEKEYNNEVKVKILPDSLLYKAEEFHQDFPLRHKKELDEEMILSGRVKK